MLCVIYGVSDSGVGVREISIPISSRCCTRLRNQQLGLSCLECVMAHLGIDPIVVVGVSAVSSVVSPLCLLHRQIGAALCG